MTKQCGIFRGSSLDDARRSLLANPLLLAVRAFVCVALNLGRIVLMRWEVGAQLGRLIFTLPAVHLPSPSEESIHHKAKELASCLASSRLLCNFLTLPTLMGASAEDTAWAEALVLAEAGSGSA